MRRQGNLQIKGHLYLGLDGLTSRAKSALVTQGKENKLSHIKRDPVASVHQEQTGVKEVGEVLLTRIRQLSSQIYDISRT